MDHFYPRIYYIINGFWMRKWYLMTPKNEVSFKFTEYKFCGN